MLSWIAPGQLVLTHPVVRPAILTLLLTRRIAFLLVVLPLLMVRTALSAAPVLPFDGAGTPTMHDPLPMRVRYIRALVADAEYQLALKPRVIVLWRWQIAVLPVQPDARRAWDDALRISPLALDQPDVQSLLWHIQLAYERMGQDALVAQQAHAVYSPDYTPVRTLLDVIDTDLAAALSGPAKPVDNQGACTVCGLL